MSSAKEKESLNQEQLNPNDSTKNSDEEADLSQLTNPKQENEENEESRLERERKLSEEIDKAIQARKECIRKECMKARKRLDLGSSRIDDLDTFTIALYLSEKHTNLELIHLGANLFGNEGLINILSGLQYHEDTIREIYFGNNNFSTEGLLNLCDVIPQFKNIEILSLGNIGLNNEVGVSLAYALSDLKKLKSLMVNTNKLGDDFFMTLSILFSNNKLKLKTLQIGENPVTSRGIIPLFKSLANNDTLKDLYINDICLQNDAMKALSRMLIRNTTISHLNIGNCGIDDESMLLLKSGLIFNTSLRMLNLWSNRLTNDGAFILLNILLENNHYLTQITLSDNQISEPTIVEGIKMALKENSASTKKTDLDKQTHIIQQKTEQNVIDYQNLDEERLKLINELENDMLQHQEMIELKRQKIIEIKESRNSSA